MLPTQKYTVTLESTVQLTDDEFKSLTDGNKDLSSVFSKKNIVLNEKNHTLVSKVGNLDFELNGSVVFAEITSRRKNCGTPQFNDSIVNAIALSEEAFGVKSNYFYGMRNRPFGISCQPNNHSHYITNEDAQLAFQHFDPDGRSFRYGVVCYQEPLTDNEIYSFELTDLNAKPYFITPIARSSDIERDCRGLVVYAPNEEIACDIALQHISLGNTEWCNDFLYDIGGEWALSIKSASLITDSEVDILVKLIGVNVINASNDCISAMKKEQLNDLKAQ